MSHYYPSNGAYCRMTAVATENYYYLNFIFAFVMTAIIVLSVLRSSPEINSLIVFMNILLAL